MVTTSEPDWLSQEFLADPYPHYKRLRETTPVHFDPQRRRWLITRYADVARILRDDVAFTAQQSDIAASMLVSDPPQHTRLRALVSKAFTPREVKKLEPRIHQIVDDLLDGVSGEPGMDAIAAFAYPLPITVIAELLGVEPERRDFFRSASQKIAVAMGPISDQQVAATAQSGRDQLVAYFNELIERRRREPRDDLVTALIQAEDDGRFLTHGELLAMLLLLLVGGHETTVNLIANGLLALLRNRDQFALFASTPGIEPQAVEEFLRYDTPVHYTGRIVRTDTEIDGTPIRAGDEVRLILAAANRDPAMFPNPDELDITREQLPNLSFGAGVHYCLGAPLARIEGAIALSTLVRRFPNMRVAEAELRYRPAPVLRGLEALPITF